LRKDFYDVIVTDIIVYVTIWGLEV